MAAVVERRYVKRGGKILKSAKALGYERQTDGSLAVRVDVGGKTETIVTDVVLVAVGMRPERGGPRPRGARREGRAAASSPPTRPGRTNVPGIYAIGDVQRHADARAQGDQGGRDRRRGDRRPQGGEGLGAPSPPRSSPTPRSPPRASASSRPRTRASRSGSGKFPFAALGRAMAVSETDGFFKVVADKKTHELLGVHIVGPEATDLISEGALALEMHAFLEDVGAHHPPAPDAGRGDDGGGLHALGRAIHVMNR